MSDQVWDALACRECGASAISRCERVVLVRVAILEPSASSAQSQDGEADALCIGCLLAAR